MLVARHLYPLSICLGKRVIVLDAAVLLEAQWTVAANEVWIASIPPKEVRIHR